MNAAGAWFVDTTCIDCDVSRQCAPWMFGEADDQAVVVRQPQTAEEERQAARALTAQTEERMTSSRLHLELERIQIRRTDAWLTLP